MKNKLIFHHLRLFLIIVSLLIPTLTFAETFEVDGIYYYRSSSVTEVYVTSGSTKYTGEIIIPESVEYSGITYSVTSIGGSAFSGCNGLTSISIPNSVTSIGGYAFRGCSGLTSISIPNSVTSIGSYAFRGCSELTNISIPNSVTSIGSSAFKDCSGLTSISIGNSVTSIEGSVFSGCSGLISIYIPNSVTSIGESAFNGCSGLTGISIPNSVIVIGNSVFNGCVALKEISFEDGDSKISLGYNYSAFIGLFYDCPLEKLYLGRDLSYDSGKSPFYDKTTLTSLTIGDSVTSIGDYMFYECSGLTDISIPNSVTSIGNYAFNGCTSLTSISIPNSVTSIGHGAFNGCEALKVISFEDGESEIYLGYNSYSLSSKTGKGLFYDCPLENLYLGRNLSYDTSSSSGYSPFHNKSSLAYVTIGRSVTSIAENVFYGCSGLTGISIPNSVTAIGNSVFSGCVALKEISFEDGESKISLGYNYSSDTGLFYDCPLEKLYMGRDLSYGYGKSPFYNKISLTSIIIGGNVTSIGDYSLYGCSGLTDISIPNSVTSIGNYAFSDCTGLTSLTIPNSVTSIGNYAFSDCIGLTSITIPNSVSSIGSSAFNGCIDITSITIPNSVTSIGDEAFNGCEALKEITLEDGESEISLGGTNIFSRCPLEMLYLGRGLSYDTSSSYGYSPFYNIISLTSITIGGSATSIGNYAFYGCSSLKSISIPNSVASIGNYAFSDCTGLTNISIPNSVTTIGSYTFSGCSDLTDITIPNSVTAIGNDAFNGCIVLKDLTFEDGESEISLGNDIFRDCPLERLYLGRDLSYDVSYSFGYSPFIQKTTLADITIGESVTCIGEFAFSRCSSLTSIALPSSVTSIGGHAFWDCSSLTSITIGNSVTSIGDYAFWECPSLTSISIPGSVTSIGDYAFNGCTSLKELAFEDGESEISLGCNPSSSYSKKALFYDCPLERLYLGRDLSYNTAYEYGYSPFYNRTNLADITIGESVTSIGESLFLGCSSLTSISIPHSVTYIGDNAFGGCTTLKEITFEDGETNISLGGTSLFSRCPIEKLFLGRSLSYDTPDYSGDSPFYYKMTLADLTIGESVTSIGEAMFRGCSSLTSITLPGSVTSIGNYAFFGCTSLRELIFEDGESSISLGGTSLLSGCPLEKLYLGRDLYYETSDASSSPFDNKPKLTSITIGEKVSIIPEYAFYSILLEEINTNAIIAPAIYSNSFSEFSFLNCKVFVPDGAIDSYRERWSMFNHFLTDETISQIFTVDNPGDILNLVSKDDVERITEAKLIGKINGTDILTLNKMVNLQKLDLSEATIVSGGMPYYEKDNERFGTEDNVLGENWAYNLELITELKLPINLVRIAQNAFYEKIYLSGLTIPASVESIENNTFNGCKSLKELTFEDGESEISLGYNSSNNEGLFYDCPLEKLYLGRDLSYGTPSYSFSPFNNKSSLTSVIIGGSVTYIGNSMFYGCSGLNSISIPNSVTSIGDRAFEGCTTLKELTLEDGESHIYIGYSYESYSRVGLFNDCPLEKLYQGRDILSDNFLFRDKKTLTEVVIGNSVTSIENRAFQNCSGIIDLSIGNSVTSIGSNAFQGCSGIIDLSIGNSVTSIGSYAFQGCSGIIDLSIGNSVTSIGSYAFKNCSGIIALSIGNSVTSIGSNAFQGCSGIIDLSIGNSVTSVEQYAFSGCRNLTSVAIPDPVTRLPERVFENCTRLKSLIIPGSMREIDATSFSNCDSITTINVINPIPPVIESSTFSACDTKAAINVPEGSMGIYWIHPYWGKFKKIETWDSGTNENFVVDNVTYHVTSEADATVEITAANIVKPVARSVENTLEIPASVELNGKSYRVAGIANNGFEGSEISALILPETINYVGLEAFKGCETLSSITCHAILPPSANSNSFDEATYSTAELRVPEEVVYAYESHAVWQRFNVLPIIPDATSISLDVTEWEGTEGDKFQLSATILPEKADQTVTWSSSDEAVATVDSEGNVTAVAPGTATITAKTANGLEATCKVTVNAKIYPAEGIALNITEITLVEGDNVLLEATISPENTTDKTVTWSSSDEAVATVDADGNVTAVVPGTATITAKTENSLEATCKVTVNARVYPAESIVLNITEISLVEGDNIRLEATISPENTTDKSVTWSSSDETVATVDTEGNVTAVAPGVAIITAKTVNGLEASCRITVSAKSGLDSVYTGTISIKVREGVIIVTAPEGAEVDVYTPAGLLVKHTTEHRIDGLSGGVYIVYVSGKVAKVMI